MKIIFMTLMLQIQIMQRVRLNKKGKIFSKQINMPKRNQ